MPPRHRRMAAGPLLLCSLLLAGMGAVGPAAAVDLSFNLQMQATPTKDDQYCERGFNVPSEFVGMHVVGFEPLPGTAAHHMILYWCEQPMKSQQTQKDDCSTHERGIPCGKFAYVWALNGSPLYLPPHVGIRIGPGGAETFGLQLHYGFPVPAGFVDTSGVRVIVSRNKDPTMFRRPSVVLLAPYGGFELLPGLKEHIVAQNGRGTGIALPFTLFAVRTHAHIRGRWNDVTVVRGGEKPWNFKRDTRLVQSFTPLEQYFRVMPKDSLDFRCAYDTTQETRTVREGSTKNDEMCNVYLYGFAEPPPVSIVRVVAPALNASQVVGVTARGGSVIAFTRASRTWTGASFGPGGEFRQPAIDAPTLFEYDHTTGAPKKQMAAGVTFLPHAVRADPVEHGVVWLVDVGSHTVSKFDTDRGVTVMMAGQKLKPMHDETGFCQPTDVAFSSDLKFAYVTDGYCNNRIVVLRRDDMSVVRVMPLTNFNIPHSVVVATCNGKDLLLICNREAGTIVIVEAESGAVKGTLRAWDGSMHPYAVAIGSRGRIVAGLVNHKTPSEVWISEDEAVCTSDYSAVKGKSRPVTGLVQPHLMHVVGENLLIAEAVDGISRGGLWELNL